MNRRALGFVVLASLVALSGCMGAFGGIPDEQLCEDRGYDWETSAVATYQVTTKGDYETVYNMSGQKTIELYREDGLGNKHPVQIRAVKFRYPDGTTVDCKDIDVETTRRKTIVTLPAEEGQFAYVAPSSPKRFTTRKFVEGSHEVVLPEDREVENMLFGSVKPSGYETSRDEAGRLHITWEEVNSQRVVVQYYLQRDVYLLTGLVLVAGILTAAGMGYYYRLIERLRRRREEAGLDLDQDIDDDSDRGPPPGMR